jgi:hypothetical protein
MNRAGRIYLEQTTTPAQMVRLDPARLAPWKLELYLDPSELCSTSTHGSTCSHHNRGASHLQ